MTLRYVQLLDALDFGDAVSNQVIRIHQMLLDRGEKSEIFSRYVHDKVTKYWKPFSDFYADDKTVIIHHFYGYSEIAEAIISLRCYKILVYHNITPYQYFQPDTRTYNLCKKGKEQLKQIIKNHHLVLGDSRYNCDEVEEIGATKTEVLPIVVPAVAQDKINNDLVQKLRFNRDKIWLFVGRIAPNKKQGYLIDIFANYLKNFPEERHHLYLVGRYYEDDLYYLQICSQIERLGLRDCVTLCGKVADEEIPAYYRAADLFLCMSEHEGFCVPIIEAFNSKVPVVAYAKTAVKETMCNSPGALDSLDVARAVARIHSIFTDESLKERLITYGLEKAKNFHPEAIRNRLDRIIDTRIKNPYIQKKILTVSVVICTCDRPNYLQRCLNYLKDQDYPYFEVVVVDSSATNETINLLANRKDVKIVCNPIRNLSISRNLGIQKASGDIVAFIDDDALPYDNWISELVKCYRESPFNVAGVGGRTFYANQLFFQFESGISDLFGQACHAPKEDPRLNDANYYRYLMGTNSSFYKDTLIAVNGFDEQYDYYLDETDLAVRLQKAGYLVVYADEAYVRHEFAQSHNRLGKYNFNWKTIVKNTVYFGIKNAAEIAPLPQRIRKTAGNVWQERCTYFIEAWRKKDLSLPETLRYCNRAIAGAVKGYYDSSFPRKFGKNLETTLPFLPYLESDRNENTQQKMHILIISQEFPPNSYGGIGVYNQILAKELIQMGHEVTVISRGSQERTDVIGLLTHIQVASVENNDCLPEYPILSKNIAWARKVAKIARQIHAERPISIVESALWDFEGIGILMLRPELNIPLVVRLVTPLLVSIKTNGWQMSEDFKLCAQMEKELVRCADAVVAISESIQNSFISTYDVTLDDRWTVQLLGVQPWATYTNVSNYGELPQDLKRGKIQLLFLGRLESRKGIDVFLQALKLVLPKDSRISVWIAGADIEGWQIKASDLLDRDSLKRVQFLNMVSEERRELLYANCDFFIFPSRYESFGLVALEAMVHGKPVIGARAGAIPEVVVDGDCGLLFEPDNSEDLANKILTLANDETLRAKLASRTKPRVEFLSARNMAKASVRVYNAILPSKDSPKIIVEPKIKQFEQAFLQKEEKLNFIYQDNNYCEPKQTMQELSNQHNCRLDVSPEWKVTKPSIIKWSFLNPLFNRLIVPKLVKFIESVLYESMQKQEHVNKVLIQNQELLDKKLSIIESGFKSIKPTVDKHLVTLEQKIESDKQDLEQQLIPVQEKLQTNQENIEQRLFILQEKMKATNETLEQRLLILQVRLQTNQELFEQKLSTLNNDQENNLIQQELTDVKKLLYEIQNLTIAEGEMNRSEFAYRLKMQESLSPTIINENKLKTHQDNLRLNLGCGLIVMEDYINIDQRELPGVDIVADVSNLPFEKETISEIYSAHVIEHFTEFELTNHLLPYWHQILKNEGKLVIICPDAESMIKGYVEGNFPWENLRKVTYGAQDYAGDYHYNMYTTQSLCAILSKCGFKNIAVVDTQRVNGLCYEMEIHAVK